MALVQICRRSSRLGTTVDVPRLGVMRFALFFATTFLSRSLLGRGWSSVLSNRNNRTSRCSASRFASVSAALGISGGD